MYLNCLKPISENALPFPFISLKAILSGSAYQDRWKKPLCSNCRNVFFPQRLRDISLFSQSENRTSTIRKMTISVTVGSSFFFCLHASVWRKLKRPISNCKVNNKKKCIYLLIYICSGTCPKCFFFSLLSANLFFFYFVSINLYSDISDWTII